MRYGIVVNGVSINEAEGDRAEAPNWHQSNTVKRGDEWDGSAFTTPGLNLEEAQAVAAESLAGRVVEEGEKDFTVGSITTSLIEMRENKDLLDGSADVTLNLRSGPTLIRAAQHANARAYIQDRFRDIRNRESVIAELLDAQTTADDVIDTLKTEIDSGWP